MKPVYDISRQLLHRASRVLAGGVSSEFRKAAYPHAMFYDRASGSRIWDVDGNEYIDFTLSQGPMLLGHSHPKVLKEIQEYATKGQLFAGQHIKEIELAEFLHRIIPSAELMRFSLDGSTAVQAALRVARAKTGRRKFLRFEGHYHGWLDNVCWGLSIPAGQSAGSKIAPNVFPWTSGLPEESREEFTVLPWNDLSLLQNFLEKTHREIAAVITEPVMCNNGCILPEEGYLQGMCELCNRYEVALIFDEVITGFRMSLGGAQEYFGVTPDLSIFGKALASGYPISVIAGKKEWMRLIENSSVIHAGTMNSGNPSVAAALATLRILEEQNAYPRLFRLGQRLMEGLKIASKRNGQNLVVQGPGPMFNVCFTDIERIRDYRDTLAFDKDKLARFIAGMHDLKIRIIRRGLWYISIAHMEDDIDKAINAADEVLASL